MEWVPWTAAAVLAAAASGAASSSAPTVELVWSDPVLVEGPTDETPAGPPVPDGFHAFDSAAMVGVGAGGALLFSPNGGRAWVLAPGGARSAHPGAAVLPPLTMSAAGAGDAASNATEARGAGGAAGGNAAAAFVASAMADPSATSAPKAGATAAPPTPPAKRLVTVGAVLADATPSGWTLTGAEVLTLWPNGSGFDAAPSPSPNVTFLGVPHPGANVSSMVKPGRNYGVARAADGRYVLQTDVVWNGEPGPHRTGGVTWSAISVVSFTSADGVTWEYGGVIANWSSVSSPAFGPGPVMWGPSESDVAMLSDNRTLVSVVRMDGDGACFAGSVPSRDRNANSTTYRNYAVSFSTDGKRWTFPSPVPGTGCARPRVARLSSGPLLLTGGRLCVENTTGVFLWVNPDGMAGFGGGSGGDGDGGQGEGGSTGSTGGGWGGAGAAGVWERHSITAQHNRLWKGDPKYLFTEAVNDTSVFETLAYTSVMPTGPRSAAIAYNKFFYKDFGPNHTVKSWPGPNANFVIQVSLK